MQAARSKRPRFGHRDVSAHGSIARVVLYLGGEAPWVDLRWRGGLRTGVEERSRCARLCTILHIHDCASTLSMMKIRTVNELGATIRRARKQRGWTQEELAMCAGISRRTLVALEGGNPRGEIGIVVRVIAALDRELAITERPNGGDDDLLGHMAGAGQ